MPAGVEVTGKNGAIPDPEGNASARAHVFDVLCVLLGVQTSIAKLGVLLHGEGLRAKVLKRGKVEGEQNGEIYCIMTSSGMGRPCIEQ